MPDEQTGAPVTETPASTGTEAIPKVGSPESGGVPETPPIDPRYAGKSMAELVDIIREKEQMVGRLGEKVGKVDQLEQQIGNLQDYLSRMDVTRQERAPEPVSEDFDLTNPGRSVKEIVARERQQIYQDFNKYRQKEMYDEAVANFSAGRRAAMAGNKDLFDGIENEVSNQLWEAVKANPAARHSLRDPDVWTKAARIIWAEKEQWDRVIPKKTQAMAPPRTELPGKTTRTLLDDDEVTLTDDDRLQASFEGISEKDALEAKKLGTEMFRRGQMKGGVRR